MTERMRTEAQRLQVLKEVKSCISQVTLSMKIDRSLGEVLQGLHNIVYEAKDDTTGVSFEKNGVKKWVPIVVTNYGKELSVKEMERCKKIVHFQNENGPQFSIRNGKCQFPTPIARRTRLLLKSETL